MGKLDTAFRRREIGRTDIIIAVIVKVINLNFKNCFKIKHSRLFQYLITEQFFWRKHAKYPLPLFNNIVGVVVATKSIHTRTAPVTIKVLVMQPENNFVKLLIQCDSKDDGNDLSSNVFTDPYF